MQWLIDVLNGEPSTEAAKHLQRAFIAWARSSGSNQAGRHTHASLPACLGLPNNPRAAQLKIRDWYLVRASLQFDVEPSERWQRARLLHAAAGRFERRKWPLWWSLDAPPSHADGVDVLLWHAAQAGGGKLPGTEQRYRQIIGDC